MKITNVNSTYKRLQRSLTWAGWSSLRCSTRSGSNCGADCTCPRLQSRPSPRASCRQLPSVALEPPAAAERATSRTSLLGAASSPGSRTQQLVECDQPDVCRGAKICMSKICSDHRQRSLSCTFRPLFATIDWT